MYFARPSQLAPPKLSEQCHRRFFGAPAFSLGTPFFLWEHPFFFGNILFSLGMPFFLPTWQMDRAAAGTFVRPCQLPPQFFRGTNNQPLQVALRSFGMPFSSFRIDVFSRNARFFLLARQGTTLMPLLTILRKGWFVFCWCQWEGWLFFYCTVQKSTCAMTASYCDTIWWFFSRVRKGWSFLRWRLHRHRRESWSFIMMQRWRNNQPVWRHQLNIAIVTKAPRINRRHKNINMWQKQQQPTGRDPKKATGRKKRNS